MTEDQMAEAAGLHGKVSRGLRWSVVNTIISRMGSLLTGIVLARILEPKDYGVYAVALVVLSALLSMNELGVSLAVVRWDRDPRQIAPTVATLSVLTSGVLYAACFLAAPFVARTLNAPSATTMIRVLCLCVFVDAAAAVPAAIMARAFEQRRRFVVDISAFVIGTALSIGLALAGVGAWALIAGFILSNVVAGVMAIALAPWRTGLGFDRQIAADLLHFGLPLAGSSMVLFLMLNADYVIVGHLLGSASLGLYLMAFNLCSWPVNIVSTTVRRVALSGFSRVSGAGEGPRSFMAALGSVLLISVPMCVGLAVFAPQLMGLLYGRQWVPGASSLRWLAVLALARIVVELVYDYLVSADRNHSNLAIQVVWLVAFVPAAIVGAHLYGIMGVALAHALVVLCVVVPVITVALRGAGVRPGPLWRATRGPLLTAVPMIALGATVGHLISQDLVGLVVGGALSVGIYTVLNARQLRELRGRVMAQPSAA